MGFFNKLWGKVREGVASWLRSKKLEESVLMDAWVGINKHVDAVTRVARTALKREQTQQDSQNETVMGVEQIDDPEVLALARKQLKPKRRKRRVVKQVN